MKKIIIALTIMALTLCSCKKEDTPTVFGLWHCYGYLDDGSIDKSLDWYEDFKLGTNGDISVKIYRYDEIDNVYRLGMDMSSVELKGNYSKGSFYFYPDEENTFEVVGDEVRWLNVPLNYRWIGYRTDTHPDFVGN